MTYAYSWYNSIFEPILIVSPGECDRGGGRSCEQPPQAFDAAAAEQVKSNLKISRSQ